MWNKNKVGDNMFCRFCGKTIQEDSEFCPYCGKMQNNQATETRSNNLYTRKKINIDLNTLSTIASIVFYAGIVVFLILFLKMAPGVGNASIVAYFIGAAITILLAVFVHKLRDKEYTKKRELIALVFGLVLLIPSITLRIVYEAKVDEATASVPKSGTVCVEVRLDEQFYSYYGEGMIRNPDSYITIDGKKYDSTTTLWVDLNKPYTVKIGAGYDGKVGVASSSSSGSTSKTITFTQSNLQGGYTIKEKVSLKGGGYADVTISFKRECTFWEVILYNPY